MFTDKGQLCSFLLAPFLCFKHFVLHQDQLSADMYSFVAKEIDYASYFQTVSARSLQTGRRRQNIVVCPCWTLPLTAVLLSRQLIEVQAEYHRKSLELLQSVLPQIKAHQGEFFLLFLTSQEKREEWTSVFPHSILTAPLLYTCVCFAESWVEKPCYGKPLEEHLALSGRDIAFPIEACVTMLLECGMQEEVRTHECVSCFCFHMTDKCAGEWCCCRKHEQGDLSAPHTDTHT